MKNYRLGKSSVVIPEQVFGCWAIGGTYFTGAEDAKSIAAIWIRLRPTEEAIRRTLPGKPSRGMIATRS